LESAVADGGRPVYNRYCCQRAAHVERAASDSRDISSGHGHRCDRVTTVECSVVYGRDAIGDGYGGHRRTSAERIAFDARDTVGDRDRTQ